MTDINIPASTPISHVTTIYEIIKRKNETSRNTISFYKKHHSLLLTHFNKWLFCMQADLMLIDLVYLYAHTHKECKAVAQTINLTVKYDDVAAAS